LHLTQYPSAIKTFTVRASCPNDDTSLTKSNPKRNPEKEAVKVIECEVFANRNAVPIRMKGLC
jgi:hypothetical protein